jgi:hypothetical protein
MKHLKRLEKGARYLFISFWIGFTFWVAVYVYNWIIYILAILAASYFIGYVLNPEGDENCNKK